MKAIILNFIRKLIGCTCGPKSTDQPHTWELRIDPKRFSRSILDIVENAFEIIIEERAKRSEIEDKDWVVVYLYPKDFNNMRTYAFMDKEDIDNTSFKWKKANTIFKLLPKTLDWENIGS